MSLEGKAFLVLRLKGCDILMKVIATCFVCRKIVDKDTIALNKKLIGRSIDKFFCIDCLADYLDVSVEDLLNKVQEFREQGCTLFF